MKHRFIINILVLALSFILVIVGAYSCKKAETAIQVEQQGTSFIWKVSLDTTHVYLLGSVHVASPDLYPLDKTIEDAFGSAIYLVVESNTNNVSQIDMAGLLGIYGMYPQGSGFKENVPEELYSKLDKLFQENEIKLSLFNDYKPFVIYNLMSQLILVKLGYKLENGIDLYFMDKANKNNKSILELETIEYQLSMMSSIPDEVIIRMMQYDIDNPETDTYLEGLFKAWQEGDTAKMETVAFEALADLPEIAPYYEIMYDQRNYRMVQKIEEFLAGDEVYFILVGAGHLVGEKGLINLLKNKGYNIEQLDNSD